MTSFDLPRMSLSKKDVSGLLRNIEETRARLKELEAELEVRPYLTFVETTHKNPKPITDNHKKLVHHYDCRKLKVPVVLENLLL
jgi:hypothetical protein